MAIVEVSQILEFLWYPTMRHIVYYIGNEFHFSEFIEV